VARASGNKKLLDQVKADRKAYEEKDEVPKGVPAAKRQKLAASRMALEAAYAAAIRDYTKAKKDDEAAAVEKELDEFKKGGGVVQVSRDALQKGTVWKGERTFTKGASAGKSVEFELNVTARSGKTFSGFTATHDVEGTIEDGKIEWKVIRQRSGTNPGQPHKGEVRGDTLVLTFEGMGAGGPNAGTAKLVLQKPK
jgi:hypothetical protein